MSATTVVYAASQILALLTLINGTLMIAAPKVAAEKVYKFGGILTPTCTRLIVNNGFATLCIAVTGVLVSFIDTMPPLLAIGYGMIPRFLCILYNLGIANNKNVKLQMGGFIPLGTVWAICCFPIFFAEANNDKGDNYYAGELAAQAIGFTILVPGLVISIFPNFVAKTGLKFDSVIPTERGLLRSQGKTDIIDGVQKLLLGMNNTSVVSIHQALGLSCAAWVGSIILNDVFLKNNEQDLKSPRQSVYIQLVIATAFSIILLLA